ncbi:MAG TPA: molybdenum cofactor guanylyltransferase [Tepidisphaeraceae bacterium]|jgi:molybdopterin-guanine dinucleotide biosynthesis protein A|nr:molybdenum cofactor guanylyltransferase [Tepidisphaeraceae bacterium]
MDVDSFALDATLAILAGGAGTRMGGPKGRLTLAGQPILEYLLDRLVWAGPTMLITAPGREHPPGWRRFHREISDPASGGGPLRGILTALEHLQSPYLIVLTIDMPGVRLPHCAWLLHALHNDSPRLGVMSRRRILNEVQIEPFPCALRLDAISAVAGRLSQEKRSVQGLLSDPGFVAVDPPGDWPNEVWTNLNAPEDLERFSCW